MKTHVYIDGFNLYYGLLKGTPHKWLNLELFCDQPLPKNTVEKIYYFTARVDARPYDPDQPTRQMAYLRALTALARVETYYGSFMSSVVSQPLVQTDPATGRYTRNHGKPVMKVTAAGNYAQAWVLKSEEKGSDVNLAAYLLRDAYTGACPCAVIVSNDSDLVAPIKLAKTDCGLTIGLVRPRPKGSVQLMALADFKIDPRDHILAGAQFPKVVATPSGDAHKPASW